jgi:GH18 family chitinase
MIFALMDGEAPVLFEEKKKRAHGRSSQSNCGQPTVPSCGVDEQTALQRRIGYYEGWANSRKCSPFSPQQIDGSTLTHVNFAFGLISSSFKIVEMTAGDSKLWSETTELKKGYPGLKVFLSIGGWTFNDPPTQSRFSDVASSAGNRATFVGSCLDVMQTYGFDASALSPFLSTA